MSYLARYFNENDLHLNYENITFCMKYDRCYDVKIFILIMRVQERNKILSRVLLLTFIPDKIFFLKTS